VHHADDVIGLPGAKDLVVAGVVAEESGLGEHEGEERGAGQLPPRVAQQEERGPAGGEQQRVADDLGGVVDGSPVEQPSLPDLTGQLGVGAAAARAAASPCWVDRLRVLEAGHARSCLVAAVGTATAGVLLAFSALNTEIPCPGRLKQTRSGCAIAARLWTGGQNWTAASWNYAATRTGASRSGCSASTWCAATARPASWPSTAVGCLARCRWPAWFRWPDDADHRGRPACG
jgi:hypothetical protein